MNDDVLDEFAVERTVERDFGVTLEVKQMIVTNIPVSHTAVASVFLSTKHQLFVLVRAESNMTLGEVNKIAKKMGCEVELFLPPHRDVDYFSRIAREKFRAVFPGRHGIDESELRYYRKLSPYNPALFKVSGIVDSTIRQFDSHDSSGWRSAAKFAYKQIQAR